MFSRAQHYPNGSVAKVAKFHTDPYNFVPYLPNPYKLSILGDIWRTANLPFSASEYFYSWSRLLNLVDLPLKYLRFSNERKTTILFPSLLTFLQLPMVLYNNYSIGQSWIWSDKITNERVARVGYNHFISNKGEWNNCFSKLSKRVLSPIFISTILQSGKLLNLAHYFPYDVKLRLLAHSRRFFTQSKS